MDDELDGRIIELLAANGRMSYTDLGKATGLSTSAAHQRVRRLEERGTIRGYAAVIAPESIGLPLSAFVSIKPFDPASPDDVAERVSKLRQVEACYSVAGEENYILLVRVPSPADLEQLLAEVRATANVSTRTTVVLSTAFEHRAPMLGTRASTSPPPND